MGAMSRSERAAVDPVEPEQSWYELLPANMPVHLPPASESTWHLGGPGRGAERLRSMAVTVWLAWLITAGVIVGGTLLVVLVRLATTVLRWAVAA